MSIEVTASTGEKQSEDTTGIVGSPHKEGNTEILTQHILDGAEERGVDGIVLGSSTWAQTVSG